VSAASCEESRLQPSGQWGLEPNEIKSEVLKDDARFAPAFRILECTVRRSP
jgi:hypothetical protein